MKILLAQLAGQRIAYGRIRDNEPVAAGCLKSALVAAGDGRNACAADDVEILHRDATDYYGDQLLLEAVAAKAPDVLGLSLYCWNVGRSLWLSRELKRRRPQCAIVAGGPEVAPDNAAILNRGALDFLIAGEGENAFVELIAQLRLGTLAPQGAPRWFRASLPAPVDLARLPSPYRSGYLDPTRDSYLIFETVRGCPFRCVYCSYNKTHDRVRFYPLDNVRDTLRFAIDNGVADVFFMDPSFNARDDLDALLSVIAGANPERRLSLHTELRADLIDDATARRLRECGFDVVEIGLQSANPKVLRRIRRPTDLGRFVAGVRALEAAGIDTMLDVILGLPGEGRESALRTLDFVRERRLGGDVQVFPLAVLPGAEVRARSDEWGIRYDPEPPYLVTSTPDLAEKEIRALFAHAEELFDTTFDPVDPPPLTERPAINLRDALAPGTGSAPARCVHKVILELDGGAARAGLDGCLRLSQLLANNIVLWIKAADLAPHRAALQRLVECWTRENPNLIVSLIVEPRQAFDPELALELGDHSRQEQDHFLNHYYRHRFGGVAPCAWQTWFAIDGSRLLPRRWIAGIRESFSVIGRESAALDDPVEQLAARIDDWQDAAIDLRAPSSKRDLDAVHRWMDSLATRVAHPDLVSFTDRALHTLWTREVLQSPDYAGFPELIVRPGSKE